MRTDDGSRVDPRWLAAAGWIGVGWAIATTLAAFFGMTIGLITGLVVLIIPAYLLLTWLAVVAVVVCLAQWRGRRHLARVLAGVTALGPAVTAVGAYLRARLACSTEVNPQACRDYLDGSPLLFVLIVVAVLAGAGAFGLAWAVTSAGSGRRPRP